MYKVAKYARSLIREFGRKDEKPVALMWIDSLKNQSRDGYLDYFYHLISRIYAPGIFQEEYLHEHVCRVFNSYPKIVTGNKYPAFSIDSDQKAVSTHMKLLVKEIEIGNNSEKEIISLRSDLQKFKDYPFRDKGFPKRISTVDFNGNIIIRFATLDVTFNYSPCEVSEEIAGSAAAAIINWRLMNPIPEEKKEPPKKELPKIKDSFYGGYGDYGSYRQIKDDDLW